MSSPRLCECGCGEPVPSWQGVGPVPRFAGDTCRQRAHRAAQARRDAIEIWDLLGILDERPVLQALMALNASARADLLGSLRTAYSPSCDTGVSRKSEAS